MYALETEERVVEILKRKNLSGDLGPNTSRKTLSGLGTKHPLFSLHTPNRYGRLRVSN